ncbi:hypothetical protein D3C77_539830 [compost metagenome]
MASCCLKAIFKFHTRSITGTPITLQIGIPVNYDMGIPVWRGSMNAIFKDLVAFFGTQEATAEKLGVDQSTVSGWVRGKHGMSPVVAKRAEALTAGKFKKEILCPSFPWDELVA